MHARLGSIMYWAGIVGAVFSLLHGVDTIWVHQSGTSLIGISGKFVSRPEMLLALVLSFVVAGLFFAAGWSARAYLTELAARKAGERE